MIWARWAILPTVSPSCISAASWRSAKPRPSCKTHCILIPQALLSVSPVPNPRQRRERIILQGETPNPIDLPPGCRFHPRCPIAQASCREIDPVLEPISEGHEVACLVAQGRLTGDSPLSTEN